MKLTIDIDVEEYKSCIKEVENLGKGEVTDPWTYKIANGTPFDCVIENIKAEIKEFVGVTISDVDVISKNDVLEIIEKHIADMR